MTKKILLFFFTLTLLTNCEYKPIYSDLNKSNYKIIITKTTGDDKFNKYILENLKRGSLEKSNEIINLKIDTTFSKIILAKNNAGSITDYQVKVTSSFEIEKNENIETLIITEKFNYQKMSDKFEEKNYEQTIKKNLAMSIAQKLIIRLTVIK
tara:strand:+ start:1211 stop:1669 length:459 start_codon:yes stop_codon:yes gene_type:complete